jgi:hypothetical protein
MENKIIKSHLRDKRENRLVGAQPVLVHHAFMLVPYTKAGSATNTM